MVHFNWRTNSLSLMATMVLVACSSSPKVTTLPKTADPEQEISKVESSLRDALDQQVDVLSPENYASATKALDKAKKARSENKDQEDVLYDISLSSAYLGKANEVAGVAKQLLPDVVQARKNALNANAPKEFPKEFALADNDLKDVSEEIEKDDTSSAEKKRGKLENSYRDLEVNSIKKTSIGGALATVQVAIKEGAKTLTPQTLAWAEKKINDDTNIVVANLHDKDRVESASADAKAASERLLNMVRQAKMVAEKNPEQLATQFEKDQLAMAAQQEELHMTAAGLEKATEQKEKLEGKVLLEKEYEFARQQFSKDEAEVYKQGNDLLIRLKGLAFPSNRSTITSESYPLLAKVQTVLQNAGNVNVTIQGHTDAIGSKKLNQELSEKRAASVESYFISNNSIPRERIKSVGYGDTKPIATNKTEKGRMQNRRVDVIITTE